MFVVLEKNTYSGEGVEYFADYSVSRVIGSFASLIEAQAWAKGKDTYSTEYEVFQVESID